MAGVTKLEQKWPVVEIFGPTVQGEGVDQGVVSNFIRFGGCDYRCDWCDTPHAVLPAEVKANATKMGVEDIMAGLADIGHPEFGTHPGLDVPWIILTGGNPALHDLSTLLPELHRAGYLAAVETQGSRWRDWMCNVDRLCVSPKPPSAKEKKAENLTPLMRFLEEGLRVRAQMERDYEWLFIKIVIFDEHDLDYAESIRHQLSDALLYLSAGNDAGRTVGNPERHDTRGLADVRSDLLDKTLWLTEEVFKRPTLCASDVFIQSQLHVAMWGNELGR